MDSISAEISLIALIFYFGAIFWTLGYDTIYGYQDIKDDEIIGLKSTSIKFKGNSKKFLSICYLILTLCLIFGGYLMEFNWIYFIFNNTNFSFIYLSNKIFNQKT